MDDANNQNIDQNNQTGNIQAELNNFNQEQTQNAIYNANMDALGAANIIDELNSNTGTGNTSFYDENR